jgi:uncharacterized protein YjiS (DUF1127 family)
MSGFSLTANILRALGRHLRARRDASHVARFNDFMLKDIGLTRTDLLSANHGRFRRND